MSAPAPEEGKLISEALNTVKIQVQQMKRHLVSPFLFEKPYIRLALSNRYISYRSWISSWTL
jgi:hypothetical protein